MPRFSRPAWPVICRVLTALLSVLVLASAYSCGGRSSLLPEGAGTELSGRPQADPGLADLRRSLPEISGQAMVTLPGSSALPGLESLAGLPRSASLTGPGYQPILPQHYIDRNLAFNDGPTNVKLQDSSQFSFAVYALDGFKADSFPTSLKVGIAAGSAGPEYYVGFSDFAGKRWQLSGPFNDSATIPIPFGSQPQGLSDFIQDGVSYFAVIHVQPNAAAGDVVIESLALGVDGGDSAPRPPRISANHGGNGGVWFSWQGSFDEGDADFAGYVVERAELLAGDFVALTTEPISDHYYFDQSAAPDKPYRYRVGAIDTSGNTGWSIVFGNSADTTETLPPIPVIKLPEGKLFAPAMVSVDLSGSIDPGGGGFTSFSVNVIGQTPVGGPDPVINLNLQPGCFLLEYTVTTAAGSSSDFETLKVYPQWQPSTRVVLPALDTGASRVRGLGAGLQPGGAPTLFGFDQASSGLTFNAYQGGGSFGFAHTPAFLGVDEITETVPFDGRLAFGLRNDDGDFSALLFDGTKILKGNTLFTDMVPAQGCVVATADSLLLVAAVVNGGQTDIDMLDAFGGSTPVTLLPNAGPVSHLDSVYNPADNSLETVFYDGAQVIWQHWDLSNNVVSGSAVVDTVAGITNIDVELDPATQQPVVCYFNGLTARWSSSVHSGGGWSLPLLINNTVDNNASGDLLIGPEGICMTFGDASAGGPLAVYKLDTGVPAWGTRNSFTLPAVGSGANVRVMPGAAGELLVANEDFNGDVHLHSCLDDGSSSELGAIKAQAGQGRQLRGCHGSDGLHMVQVDADHNASGAFSTDGGLNWTPYSGGGFVTSVCQGANAAGDVYVSLNNAGFSGDYELQHWDPGTQNFGTVDNAGFCVPNQWPGLSTSLVGTDVVWTVYDDTLTELHIQTGSGVGPFSGSTLSVSGPNPIWNMNISTDIGSGVAAGVFVMGGGSAPQEGLQGMFLNGLDQAQLICTNEVVSSPPSDFLTNDIVRGRTMDSAIFLTASNEFFTPLPFEEKECYVSAWGSLFDGLRYTHSLQFFSDPIYEEIKFPLNVSSEFDVDFRRTVSATEAQGVTAVTLFSDLDGARSVFQWSNFGNWEDLPLPSVPHMSYPELVVGMDGRWHIVYHDYETDEIRVLSSL